MKVLRLIEELPKFNFENAQQKFAAIPDDVDNYNSNKKFFKKRKNQSSEELKYVYKTIEAWDKQGITKGFTSLLASRILQSGWDSEDVFLKWLTKANNKNISILTPQSAEALISHLDKGDFTPDDPNITEDNNLFSGSSQDIIYKLNALYMLKDKLTASKYKNDAGESPELKLMFQNNDIGTKQFKDTQEIRKSLAPFSTKNKVGNLISFETWVKEIAEWNPSEVLNNLNELADANIKDQKELFSLKLALKEIFSQNNIKKAEDFYSKCQISPKVLPTDGIKILEPIQEYIKKHNDFIKNSLKKENFLVPGSKINVRTALEFQGLTGLSGFKKLGSALMHMKDKDKGLSYYNTFKKINSNSKYYNDFLNYKITVSKDGKIPWAKTIISYIDNINTQNLIQDSQEN